MNRTNLGILLGLAVALLVALGLEGGQRVGVVVGYLLGAGLFALGHRWQLAVCNREPKRSFETFAGLFVAKLVAITAAFVVLRRVDAVAARVETTSFLLSFTAAVFLVSLLGNWDVARRFSRRPAGP